MLDSNDARALRSVQSVHLSFMATIVIYGVVLYATKGQFKAPQDPAVLRILTMLLPGVYAVALGVFFAVLRPRLVARARAMGASKLMAQYQTIVVIGNAFFESGPIYGLVLCFLGASMEVFAGFAAVCLVLMAVNFPTETHLRTMFP